MKKLFLFLLVPALSFAQVKRPGNASVKEARTAKTKINPAGGFTLTGNVQGLADGEVKITAPQGEQVIANGAAKNGVFALTGKLDEPGLYWITLGKEQPQYIFL